jgi:hypothetical protein
MEPDLPRAIIGAAIGCIVFKLFTTAMSQSASRIAPGDSGMIAPSGWYTVTTARIVSGLSIFLIGPRHGVVAEL